MLAGLGHGVRIQRRWENGVVERQFWKFNVLIGGRKKKWSWGKCGGLTRKNLIFKTKGMLTKKSGLTGSSDVLVPNLPSLLSLPLSLFPTQRRERASLHSRVQSSLALQTLTLDLAFSLSPLSSPLPSKTLTLDLGNAFSLLRLLFIRLYLLLNLPISISNPLLPPHPPLLRRGEGARRRRWSAAASPEP